MKAFGPVPSRRLGRSLGINNIPPKVCTYSCIYCQLGRTIKMANKRGEFYQPEEILKDVREKMEKAGQVGESIDYLTFVPDGEPTLDINLGPEIELLKPLGIKIAVITNSSLIWHAEVRESLGKADWVSLKVDSVREGIWRKVDRPHGALPFASILEGIIEFAKTYRGELVIETMLVRGVNDSDDQVKELADFLAQIKPAKVYLSIPTRPPAEKYVQPPEEEAINKAYQMLSHEVYRVEYLIGYEGNAFAFTGNVEEDLLNITSVHPMREEAVRKFLERAGAGWPVIRKLISEGQLIEVEYEGKRFYLRKLHSQRR